MRTRVVPRVSRTPAADEPMLPGDRHDYADAYEIRLAVPDERTAEDWARSALEGAPAPVRWTVLVAHRVLLRFRVGSGSAQDHVLGWRIVESQPDVIMLEAEGPLMRGVIVGRRTQPTTAVISTFVFYRQPRAARVIWTAVGPLHRRVAPYLLKRAART